LSSLRRSEGFVLFIVLVIVSVLASLLFSVYYLSQIGYRRVEGFKDYATAYHAAVSAVKIALLFLREDKNGFDGQGDDWARPIVYNYRGIFLSVRIQDECGKLNVNRVAKEREFEIFRRLFEELGIEPSVADSIRDWIDPDDEPQPEGAESSYYEALGYRPTNGPIKSLGELLYVKGVDEPLFKKLKNYLTIYSSGEVNVNSAPKEVLMALSPDLGPEAADSIIEARPIKDVSKLLELPGITKELYFEIRPLITNRCNFFKIEATASYGDATVQLEAYATRSKLLEWKVVQ